ncbi:amino acid adenylation domain-containing protein [Mycolicibacterium smegmatis]|uniref:Pls/PosA family non-ribosomal peptide synthetase n=1 Tax=Mycolicibacterium smegmatis TaxID=1772 RepID=UPI0005D9E3C9|nr:Pls/PosA family non-ribosomal peptide synthetase [Mycolicibacterium smegmatis]MDF1902700.1 amino acid adenylation domain-containing protein [Mycolicibacterium smegmatis]MDF1908976.1 amino acid adenylation domain-containing protein [Mycolicibacterium smegmatis]MDF1921226.1 amino acid adenylation domain-containing protein [Mycolicibacterium smegmatis]MDF1927460.1 amino acid adenylation domain-containing protein [Mycolicibacterium smegmatis]UAK57556.1 amino acid adenylation domain-containing p
MTATDDAVGGHAVPAQYLLSSLAPAPRTLIDILYDTARRFPDAPAIDDGTVQLTYAELVADIEESVAWLAARGIGRGDRIGIRMPSGSYALYVAILSVLAAGAAYVPVDADDPDERAQLVFGEAGVVGVITERGLIRGVGQSRGWRAAAPLGRDDAWIIFTSGSTGTPKGVAVTHRSAAAFVDAEARMFLQDNPIGPGDRVLAGLSVAFDASCEEMWLAWRNGACLVPAPRSLVRSGMDLGPWLVSRDITVVSTVPTLAALWPAEALESVRLLIFGGEACPPELAQRLAVDGREVWNTYGPTEATVVACAARLDGLGPVSIGLPLSGWDLAVVDRDGLPVAVGEVGELVIGGVGLARYLDPDKDREKYAPMPTLGWSRAYRSGDLVRLQDDGLYFQGRADDQVKVGGRRIELGEVDTALVNLPGVSAGAAAVRKTASGTPLLVGYVASHDPSFDLAAARAALAESLPAALVPRLILLDELPTRTSGKVDRNALPWPPPDGTDQDAPELVGTMGWLAGLWRDVLGTTVDGPEADFIALGGGSLSAAQLVAAMRRRYPQVTVADIYDHPRLGSLAGYLDELSPPPEITAREVAPTSRLTQAAQVALSVPLATLTGMQWVVWLGLLNNVAAALDLVPWAQPVNWWLLLAGFGVFITPVGRMGIAVLFARMLLSGLQPGTYRRGGAVHLRVWFAERLAEASGAENLAGAPWMVYYARALGNSVGKGVDLHSAPPVTGMAKLGHRCSIEPEVDLSGHWIDGDLFHVGPITVGNDATIGARTTLLPGATVGKNADVAPGSAVVGKVKNGQYWKGSPAVKSGKARHPWPDHRPPRAPVWVAVYGVTSILLGSLPLAGLAAGLAVIGWGIRDTATPVDAILPALAWTPVATVVAVLTYAVLTVLGVRVLSVGLSEGYHPVRSRVGWQLWATERLMDAARNYLFPVYASLLTPWWLRLLGAKVGEGTEISTALFTPKFTEVQDGAFLADDTMVASYELGGGWIHVAKATIGKRAFLGNSGITQPGRKVPDDGLVAVLSATPHKAKAGSSWLGSPPVRLRRKATAADVLRTFHPSPRLKAMRAAVETCRIIPVIITFGIGVAVLGALQTLVLRFGYLWAALASGLVLLAAGALAGLIAVAAKWSVIGRIRAVEHPLWSSFVWRNEVSDTFVETVAAPWFARAATGTPVMNLWLRALGASIGRGVWCETYWLPEADLVSLGAGATVNRGCVVQTHLFHDRIMRMDSVVLEAGSTLGPHCVALPAARLGAGATVGPGSLVMRGDEVPSSTRWQGNPIAPWDMFGKKRTAAASARKKTTEKPAA